MINKTNQTQTPTSAADNITFNHARIEPTHCLTDGLFKPFQNGAREKPRWMLAMITRKRTHSGALAAKQNMIKSLITKVIFSFFYF